MKTVNMHDAKTHLSRLVDQAVEGSSFIIAKAGKPMVQVTALDAPGSDQVRRVGFLLGQFNIPDDFDRMGEAQITALFGLDA
jgi:antitoxin (DNA-binding transcriptional repressor) of toxin-antitoxin stability system